jgi:hypothetical protein
VRARIRGSGRLPPPGGVLLDYAPAAR